MMDELPRLPVRSLPPPEGGFDRVMRRARTRRRARLAVVGGLVGGLSVVAALTVGTAEGDRNDAVATVSEETTTSEPVATTVPKVISPFADATPTTAAPTTTAAPNTTAAPTTTAPGWEGNPEPAGVHRGRVVDEAGRPLPGIWVYDDTRAATVTGPDGTYELSCRLVTLMLWGVGPNRSDSGSVEQNWAPVVLNGGGPSPCLTDPADPGTVTVMHRGAAFAGQVLDGAGQPVRNSYTDLFVGTALETAFGTRSVIVTHQYLETDENGRYGFWGLEPGDVAIVWIGGGGAPYLDAPIFTAVAGPDEVVSVDLVWAAYPERGPVVAVSPQG